MWQINDMSHMKIIRYAMTPLLHDFATQTSIINTSIDIAFLVTYVDDSLEKPDEPRSCAAFYRCIIEVGLMSNLRHLQIVDVKTAPRLW